MRLCGRFDAHGVRCADSYDETGFTDEAIKAIAMNCPLLTSLNVENCIYLTDESIEAITTNCPSLTTLKVKGCWNVTPRKVVLCLYFFCLHYFGQLLSY